MLPANVFAAEEAEEHSPIHDAMEAMNTAYRNLSRGLRNPDPAAKTDYLEWLQAIELAAVEAKPHVPSRILELPEAEQPAMIASYRSELAAAIETMMQLEQAMIADEWETVKTLGRQLGSQRSEGHKKYKPEEEE